MRRSGWTLFAIYCLVASLAWLVVGEGEKFRGVAYAVAGIAALVVNGRWRWMSWPRAMRLAVAAGMIVAAPEVIAGVALGYLANAWWTVVLTIVPAMVVLVAAQGEARAWTALGPALAGMAGFLLVVPLSLPKTGVQWVAFAALVVSAVMIAVASVWIWPMLAEVSAAQAVAVCSLANAVIFLVAGYWRGGMEWGDVGWVSMAMSAGGAVLLVMLLRKMEPVGAGARYLAIPLLSVVEGAVLLRPGWGWRLVAGVGLMAGATWWLVERREDEEVSTVLLR